MSPVVSKLLTVAVAAGCYALAFVTREDQAISTALIGAGSFTLGLLLPPPGSGK
jgi:hypothetical protein